MEPIINQQMQTPTPKSKTWLWIVIIILVALLAGAGVYYWQNMAAKKLVKANEDKIRTEMQIKVNSLEQQLNEEKLIPKEIAPAGWKTYTSQNALINFEYPETWEVTESPDEIVIKHPIFFEGGIFDALVSIKKQQITLDQFIQNKTSEDSANKIGWIKKTEIDQKPASTFTITNAMGVTTTYIFTTIGANNYIISYNSLNQDEQKLIYSFYSNTNSMLEPIDPKSTLWCQADPIPVAIGYDSYPARPSMAYLQHLGSLMTATDCGTDRLQKIYGVKGDEYTLGSNITLNYFPDANLIRDLKLIGFECVGTTDETKCLSWMLNKTVKIKDLLLLKQYIQSGKISGGSCVNCG